MKGAIFLSLVSSVAAFGAAEHSDSCPFLTSTDDDHMECNDGTFCQVPTDPTADSPQWTCCNAHGGRKRSIVPHVLCLCVACDVFKPCSPLVFPALVDLYV